MQLNLEINEEQAMALAQFVKRVGFSEFKANAVDENETYLIRDAVSKLQDALAQEGYAPR